MKRQKEASCLVTVVPLAVWFLCRFNSFRVAYMYQSFYAHLEGVICNT